MVSDELFPPLFRLFGAKFPEPFPPPKEQNPRAPRRTPRCRFLPVIVCFALCIVSSLLSQLCRQAGAAGLRSTGPQRPLPRASPPQTVRRRTAGRGSLRHPKHWVRTAQEPRLVSGCCPSPSSPPGRRAAGCLSPGRAGVSRGLMAAAPKIAVTSKHLEPRPAAFWQAKAEIHAGALLSINCWALQIKATSTHRGLPGV